MVGSWASKINVVGTVMNGEIMRLEVTVAAGAWSSARFSRTYEPPQTTHPNPISPSKVLNWGSRQKQLHGEGMRARRALEQRAGTS